MQPQLRFVAALTVLIVVSSTASAAPEAAGDGAMLEVPGGRLFYEVRGAGPMIVLLHDGLVHRETWDAQWETLPRSFRVLRYDRRGYGKSPAPTAAFSDVDDL